MTQLLGSNPKPPACEASTIITGTHRLVTHMIEKINDQKSESNMSHVCSQFNIIYNEKVKILNSDQSHNTYGNTKLSVRHRDTLGHTGGGVWCLEEVPPVDRLQPPRVIYLNQVKGKCVKSGLTQNITGDRQH